MPRSIPSQLYIAHISVHGLIRGEQQELGRDPDTGGQVKYVVDLVKALADQPPVERVDLFTRQIIDDKVDKDYAEPLESLRHNAQIVRLPAGPDAYIRKEELWDYLDIFADNMLDWLHEQSRLPDLIHSHYADAGYVGCRVANLTGIPLVHTGHSLGRDKRKRLLANGFSAADIEARYNIARRIEAEESTLATANLVITSTSNEIEDQYELYDYYPPERMAVIPPGTDLDAFHPLADADRSHPFGRELARFLNDPEKPMILALSRADERKNIASLVKAYGESERLRACANLVLIMGNRDDIHDLDDGPAAVLTDVLLLIDKYDLYGKAAVPKRHKAEDVPAIYRLAAASKGVFVNPALTEPFGLTLLEAAASGLPLIATENGGPVDILRNCNNGYLIDPLNLEDIADKLLRILTDPRQWQAFSEHGLVGVKRYYSWQAHAQNYLERIKPLIATQKPLAIRDSSQKAGRNNLGAIVSDIDQNLLGHLEGLAAFAEALQKYRRRISFGIATGRNRDSALAAIRQYNIPPPDFLITSLGTEIYYTRELIYDRAWARHIDHLWAPTQLKELLADTPGLILQDKNQQSRFKISYYYDAGQAPPLEEINAHLRQHEQSVYVSLAFGQFLDIIPIRASKGIAMRYVAQRWDIPLEHILVAGGSGADEDMMRGNTLAVVVANRHHEELAQLEELETIYFANAPYALGILEAIEHYNFFQLIEQQNAA